MARTPKRPAMSAWARALGTNRALAAQGKAPTASFGKGPNPMQRRTPAAGSHNRKFAFSKDDPRRRYAVARAGHAGRASKARQSQSTPSTPSFASNAQTLGPSTKPFNPNARQTSKPTPVPNRPGVFTDSISSETGATPPPLHGLPPRPGTQLPKSATDFRPAAVAGPRAQLRVNPNSSLEQLAGAAGLGLRAAKSRILRTTKRGQIARSTALNLSMKPLTAAQKSQLKLR